MKANMKLERNSEIYAIRIEGKTFKEIAAQYNISPGRARAICIDIERTLKIKQTRYIN